MTANVPLEPVSSQTAVPLSCSRPALLSLTDDELRDWLQQRGQPAMRIKQIKEWIYEHRATTFEAMTNLPLKLRAELDQSFRVFSSQIALHQAARDGTHKLLLRLSDGNLTECVLIQDVNRHTACISTQVGCGMGCVFCASGLNGVARNLTREELIEQLILLRNLTDSEHRLTHIVVMGMGEPLANLDNLLEALSIAGDRRGLGIGARHITISSVGLPAKIRRLADLEKQYHLAISLHASNDRLRTEIVPTNSGTGIPEILAAADYFFEKTGRQVTYEYVVLGGLNDRIQHARELVRLLKGRKAHVNLIPWNTIADLPYHRPSDTDLSLFIDELQQNGISVKVRKRKGNEIDAACGQLRRQQSELNTERTSSEQRVPLEIRDQTPHA